MQELFKPFTQEEIEELHGEDRIADSGPRQGKTVIQEVKETLGNIHTPEDVCRYVNELTWLLECRLRFFLSLGEQESDARAQDFGTFRDMVNWPVFGVEKSWIYGPKDEKVYLEGFAGVKRTEETGEHIAGGWDLRKSKEYRRLTAERTPGDSFKYRLTGEVTGRRDLVKRLLQSEGFMDELIRRLNAPDCVDMARDVVRLSIAAIENAEKDQESLIKAALRILIGKPHRLQQGKHVTAVTSSVWDENYDPASGEQYLILSWMNTLPPDLKKIAAKEIVEIHKGFTEDQNDVARSLTTYGQRIFHEYEVSAQGVAAGVMSKYPIVDRGALFPEENRLIWETFLGIKDGTNVVDTIRRLVGETGRSKDLTVESIKTALGQ